MYSNLYNGFAKIESIIIQKYDEPFEKGTNITNEEKIDLVIGILNRANYLPNTEFKLAIEPTYKLQLINRDGSSEIIKIYEDFDKNTTLLSSDKRGYYKISEKQSKKIIELY